MLFRSLEGGAAALGSLAEWLVEWKWDGIRAQIVRRNGRAAIWSRGEELITESFPELEQLAQKLPEGCVIDGEIVALEGSAPAPFAKLQQRLNRKRITSAVLAAVPTGFVAYDLLELDAADLRSLPLLERRQRLSALMSELGPFGASLSVSPQVAFREWEELEHCRARARERGAEGVMLKSLASPYGVGRKRGAWWKWKADPFTVDGVLVYRSEEHTSELQSH